MPNYALWIIDQNQGSIPLATAAKARAAKTDTVVRVRRVQAADIPYVIGLDTRVTKLAKAEYWNDAFVRYGKRRLQQSSFPVDESGVDKADPHVLGFIIGEIRAWEFGSTPCGWVFALSVEPEARLQSVATDLFEAISNEFKKAG